MKNLPFLQMLKTSVITLLLVLCMSCNSEKQIDIQGHRGCRGLMPENSLPAFEKAIDLGVHTLELDIVISKDKQVVVSHEPYLNSVICYNSKDEIIPDSLTTHYNLYKMNYDDIKQCDCGSKNHPTYPNQEKLKTYKPLLSEVFDLVRTKNSDVNFNIEIKSESDYYDVFTPQPKEYVSLVLDDIKKNEMLNRVNLQSFDLNILREIMRQSSTMETALLVDEGEDIWEKISQLEGLRSPEIVSPYFKLLDSTKVRNLKAENFRVIPWTVNKEEDMKQVISWQVDGIITDYPDRLIELMKK